MKEELTEEYKKRVIDEVQRRIDAWVPRNFMAHEALLLKVSHYPYKLDEDRCGMWFLFKQGIKYSELFHLVKEGHFEEDVQILFSDAIDSYLCKVFGG